MSFQPAGPSPRLRRLFDLLGVEGEPRQIVLDLPPDGLAEITVYYEGYWVTARPLELKPAEDEEQS